MNELYLNIYDVKIKISSSNKSFLSLAEENFFNFQKHQISKLDIKVDFVYENRSLRKERIPSLSESDLIGSTGSTVYLNGDAVYLLDFILPGLKMAISQTNGRYHIKASLKKTRRKIFLGRYFSDWERLSKVLRLTVVYPLFFLLKEKRGFDFLHASALEMGGKGFVFVGLPGVGKTRCLIKLLNHSEVNFLSDNYIFLNEYGRLFALPEIVKIKEGKKKVIENGPFLKRLPFKGTGKSFFKVDATRIKNDVPLNKIFFLKRSNRTKISRVDPEKFALDLDSLEKFTKDFYEMSYLGLLRLTKIEMPMLFKNRLVRLKDALLKTECYELVIKENEDNLNLLIDAFNK